MGRLDQLRQKRRDRVKRRKHHYGKWERFKKHGKKVRAAYQLRRFRQQEKAIRKLDRLIRAEIERLKRLRIDWNGCERLTYKPLTKAVRFALKAVDGLYVTSTTGGTHSPTSWHYKDRAVDFGSDGSEGESPEIEAQNALANAFGDAYFAELFGPDDWYIKNGVRYPGTFPAHHDHLHVAVA